LRQEVLRGLDERVHRLRETPRRAPVFHQQRVKQPTVCMPFVKRLSPRLPQRPRRRRLHEVYEGGIVGVKAWDNEGEFFWKVLCFEFGQGIASLEILFRKKNSYVDLNNDWLMAHNAPGDVVQIAYFFELRLV